ncbi:kinetochore protein SPC24 homolog [Carex rostrata]
MANHGKKVDVEKLLPLLGDTVKVLHTKKEGDVLVQNCDSAVTIMSSFLSSSRDLRVSIEDFQKKINACNREIEKVKSESVPDDELVRIQKELEEMKKAEELLLEELRDVTAKLEELDHQRISVEEKKNSNSQKEKNMIKSKKVLSMCASVANIVPNLYEQDKISGYILDKNKKRVETFEFESADFDACNQLWQMLSK